MATTTTSPTDLRSTLQGLLRGYSLEMIAKDIEPLRAAARAIPPGAQVSITSLPNEDFTTRVRAAEAVRALGFTPVPHIAARRLASAAELESFLADLAAAGVDQVFIIAGDTPRAEGPYDDALAVIRTGLLGRYGVRHVGISGYPEGHPSIPEAELWRALRDKQAALKDLGHTVSIMTQFGFDAAPILTWLERLRGEGMAAPVRVGVAGPTGAKALLRYAARCGVEASAKVMAKYGVSLTRLLGVAGPDRIILDLAQGFDPEVHGRASLHFYPFGGFLKTAEWAPAFRRSQGL
ncbi:MAG: methylenetetrahydrofolate reductase [Phenylobacterium sp.]